jgi:GTP-binding protein HflX
MSTNNLSTDFTAKVTRQKGEASEAAVRDSSGYIPTHVEPERALLAHLIIDKPPAPHMTDEGTTDEASLDELAGLAEAAGAVVVDKVTQRRIAPHAATLFGKGKVEEMGELCREKQIDVMVVDCDLSPAQARNLENALDVRVIDRSELILDIFARRAQTRQAKLQVELAQLRYQLPRLKRMWTHLERIGGGIGLRGPGETQLETDRRLAGERIALLEKQLSAIRRQKEVESVGRLEYELGALVGYTNVGKSALLNALSRPTGKKVLEANQLFATLGASTRKMDLSGGRSVLLSDTVGFVRRLPHHLVECFHSTLAEVEYADFMLLVADAADPELDDKLHAVQQVLRELEVLEKPHILVLNQCDRLDATEHAALQRLHPEAVLTSALTGEGLDDLRSRIAQLLEQTDEEIDLVLDSQDNDMGRVLAEIARHGRVLHQQWSENDGAPPQLHVHARLARRWRDKISASHGHANGHAVPETA